MDIKGKQASNEGMDEELLQIGVKVLKEKIKRKIDVLEKILRISGNLYFSLIIQLVEAEKRMKELSSLRESLMMATEEMEKRIKELRMLKDSFLALRRKIDEMENDLEEEPKDNHEDIKEDQEAQIIQSTPGLHGCVKICVNRLGDSDLPPCPASPKKQKCSSSGGNSVVSSLNTDATNPCSAPGPKIAATNPSTSALDPNFSETNSSSSAT